MVRVQVPVLSLTESDNMKIKGNSLRGCQVHPSPRLVAHVFPVKRRSVDRSSVKSVKLYSSTVALRRKILLVCSAQVETDCNATRRRQLHHRSCTKHPRLLHLLGVFEYTRLGAICSRMWAFISLLVNPSQFACTPLFNAYGKQ